MSIATTNQAWQVLELPCAQPDDRLVVCMGYSRQWVVDTLRRLGYQEAADEASRDLPEEVDLEELEKFGDQHGISRGQLMDQMGGSP